MNNQDTAAPAAQQGAVASEPETSTQPLYVAPNNLKPHPLALEFEPDPDPAFDKSIAEGGVRVPLVILDGVVLDGCRRLVAAQKAGLRTVPTLRYIGHDPVRFVIDMNVHRRHLDTSQRAMIAAKLANMRQGERTDQIPSGNSGKVSQEQAADMMNVSTDSVSTAKTVLENAPELAPEVLKGNVSLNEAGKQAKARKNVKRTEPEMNRKPQIVHETVLTPERAVAQRAERYLEMYPHGRMIGDGKRLCVKALDGKLEVRIVEFFKSAPTYDIFPERFTRDDIDMMLAALNEAASADKMEKTACPETAA